MMRLTILVLAFGLALATYDEPTTPCAEGDATTGGAGDVTTPSAGGDVTTPSAGGAGDVTTPSAGGGAGGVTTPWGGDVTTPSAGGAGGVTTPSAGGAGGVTTPSAGGAGGVTTPSAGGAGGVTTPGPQHDAPGGGKCFKCNRKPSGTDIVNLDPVLSVTNLCMATCKNSSCGNPGKDGGLLGPAECLLSAAGNALSPLTSCLIPCILNLNVIETCNAAVIATQLAKLCPSLKREGICASACACCALDNDPLLNICISACVKSDGLDVNVLAPGLLPPVNLPVKLPISL